MRPWVISLVLGVDKTAVETCGHGNNISAALSPDPAVNTQFNWVHLRCDGLMLRYLDLLLELPLLYVKDVELGVLV